jgi:hypothetical protein
MPHHTGHPARNRLEPSPRSCARAACTHTDIHVCNLPRGGGQLTPDIHYARSTTTLLVSWLLFLFPDTVW